MYISASDTLASDTECYTDTYWHNTDTQLTLYWLYTDSLIVRERDISSARNTIHTCIYTIWS